MEGRWYNQKDIDRKKWDALVENTPDALIGSTSFIWDAVAQDWDAYIAPDYSYAIPVGVTSKGGLKRAYLPLFQTYYGPLGKIEEIDWEHFQKTLLQRYKKGELVVKNNVVLSLEKDVLVTQVLSKEEYDLKNQAKRALQKFKKSTLKIKDKDIDTRKLFHVIAKELSERYDFFNLKDATSLLTLFENAEKLGCLYKVAVYEEDEIKGGLIGTEYRGQLLYVKGTVKEDILPQGAMYGLMDYFINYGLKRNCTIDFGGSNAEGVRYFNKRFGAKDIHYFRYKWDNSPLWFKFLFWAHQKIKKK